MPVLDVLKIGWIAKDALKVLERLRVQTLRFFVTLTTLVLTIKIFSTYARRKVLLPCIDDAVAGVYFISFLVGNSNGASVSWLTSGIFK